MLKLSSLVPSTAPTSCTLPLKVFGVPDFVLVLLAFMCLPPLLSLSAPVSILLMMLSEGVGVGSACVSSPILSNVAPGGLLVGFLLNISAWWELCTSGTVLLLFSSCLIEVPIGVLVLNFCQTIGVSIGCLIQILVYFLPSRSLLLLLKMMLENTLFLLLPLNIKFLGTMT